MVEYTKGDIVLKKLADTFNELYNALAFEDAFDFGGRLFRVVQKTHPIEMDMIGAPPYYTGTLSLNTLTCGCSKCGFPYGGYMHKPNVNYCPNCGVKVVPYSMVENDDA